MNVVTVTLHTSRQFVQLHVLLIVNEDTVLYSLYFLVWSSYTWHFCFYQSLEGSDIVILCLVLLCLWPLNNLLFQTNQVLEMDLLPSTVDKMALSSG